MVTYIWPTLFSSIAFLIQAEIKKRCYWKCWLSLSNGPNQQIKPHPTRWHYPSITYLSSTQPSLLWYLQSITIENFGHLLFFAKLPRYNDLLWDTFVESLHHSIYDQKRPKIINYFRCHILFYIGYRTHTSPFKKKLASHVLQICLL